MYVVISSVYSYTIFLTSEGINHGISVCEPTLYTSSSNACVIVSRKKLPITLSNETTSTGYTNNCFDDKKAEHQDMTY